MRRFNRKGFTLIELLAVIVILGLVMVVTIPSVVSAVKAARQEAYEEAITIIEKYVNDEYTKCQIDPDSIEDYNSDIISNDRGVCQLIEDKDVFATILKITRFDNDIDGIILAYDSEDEMYIVVSASVSDGGKFKGVNVRQLNSGGTIPTPKPFNPKPVIDR